MSILPKEAYISEDWFKKEQELIFSKCWHFAGLVEDLKEAGDYLTVQAGLNNIFVLLGEDDELKAYHNICRHKGTQLLRAVGKVGKVITCPYHDWAYSSANGKLLSVPKEKDEFCDIDKDCLSLKKASIGIFRGMYFVHPEENPNITLEQWFEGVEENLGAHVVEDLIEYEDAYEEHIIKANWKIVVENYIDVYHLSHLHSGTLSMYDHAKAEFGFINDHYLFWEPLTESYAKNIEENAPMPLVVDKEYLGASVPMLFPSLGLSETESSWNTFHIIPVSAEETKVQIRTKVKNASDGEFSRQEKRSRKYWKDNIRTKYPENYLESENDAMASMDFMKEDIFVCEQQQKSFHSPYFEVGASAKKLEKPVRDFQSIILKYLK